MTGFIYKTDNFKFFTLKLLWFGKRRISLKKPCRPLPTEQLLTSWLGFRQLRGFLTFSPVSIVWSLGLCSFCPGGGLSISPILSTTSWTLHKLQIPRSLLLLLLIPPRSFSCSPWERQSSLEISIRKVSVPQTKAFKLTQQT